MFCPRELQLAWPGAGFGERAFFSHFWAGLPRGHAPRGRWGCWGLRPLWVLEGPLSHLVRFLCPFRSFPPSVTSPFTAVASSSHLSCPAHALGSHATQPLPLSPAVHCLSSLPLSPLGFSSLAGPSLPPRPLCAPSPGFPEPFSWHCESSHCSLRSDKRQCCGVRMAFLRWLWPGNPVGGVPWRPGLLGPCWAAAGTRRGEGVWGRRQGCLCSDKGALEARGSEGGGAAHSGLPASRQPASRPSPPVL